jgi:hypothetical protein
MSLEDYGMRWAKQLGYPVKRAELRADIKGLELADNDQGKRVVRYLFTRPATGSRQRPAARPRAAQGPAKALQRRPHQVTPEEWLRSRTVTQALERAVNADPVVVAFREGYLPRGEPCSWWAGLYSLDSDTPRERKQAHEDLKRVGEHLEQKYGLSAGEYAAITGDVSKTQPITSRVETVSDSDEYTAAKIVLEVDHWVSPDTVEAFYRAVQHRLRRRGNRPFTESRLQLLGRVLDHPLYTDALYTKQPVPWADIARELGLHLTGEQLRKKIVERTMRELLHPRLHLPKRRK